MKILRVLLFLVLLGLCGTVHAQVVHPPIRNLTADPATCSPTGSAYNNWIYRSDLAVWKYCSGVNTWSTAGTASVAGADTQIIFNDSGVYAGDADFTWNKTTNTLNIGGSSPGLVEFLTGACGTGTAGYVKFCAHTGNVASVSENNGTVTPIIIGTRLSYQYRVCTMIIGAENGSALANADLGPQRKQCQIPFAATIVEIDVAADGGTPNVIVAKRACTASACVTGANETVTNLVSSALATGTNGASACSKTGATTGIDGFTTCSATLQNTSIAAGNWIELVSGTAGGTAKRMSISVFYTVN